MDGFGLRVANDAYGRLSHVAVEISMNSLLSVAASVVSTSSGSQFHPSPYLDSDIMMILRGKGGVACGCLRRHSSLPFDRHLR